MGRNLLEMQEMRILLLSIVLSFVFAACGRQPTYPEPPRRGDAVAVEAEALQPEVPVFFTYHYRGKKINFFVVKVDDRVLSFLDACARCYPAKKGYRSEKGTLVCRECNVDYPVSVLENGVGSCVPVRIAGSLDKGSYLIPVSLLERMADKF